MSKTNNNSDSMKKVEENSENVDSGFQSGFQDSCEFSSDKDVDTSRGISPDKNEADSGMIEIIESEPPMVFIDSLYVPEFLMGEQRSKQQLQQFPSIEKYFEQDEDGFTKLHLAILHNIQPAINTLISLAPSLKHLNIRNFCGQTALHLAVILGQHTTVRKLIDNGADVNVRDNRCNTALHLACLNENMFCVQTILSAVESLKEKKLLANLEQWNYEGETCFFIACRARKMEIVKALAKKGANVNAREGRSGYTALHHAVETKAVDVVKFLCNECDDLSLDTENYGGLTAFQLCLMTEQEDTANYLISKGATPYFTDDSDMESMDDDSSDEFSGDELEKNQIISKIAEIAVN